MKSSLYIKSLIEKGEGQTLDFKYNINDSKKIAKSIAAFANTDGGTLLIGVRDNGSIAGIAKEEELFMLEAASEYYSKPPVALSLSDWNVEGKTVLEVKIKPSTQKPHYVLNEKDKWLAYIRVNDNNVLANKILIKIWKKEKQQKPVYIKYRKREARLLSYLDQNDEATFQEIQFELKSPAFVVENLLINLVRLKIIRINVYEDRFTYALQSSKEDEL